MLSSGAELAKQTDELWSATRFVTSGQETRLGPIIFYNPGGRPHRAIEGFHFVPGTCICVSSQTPLFHYHHHHDHHQDTVVFCY